MLILEESYTHPVRAGRIRLLVYDRDGRFLVTEARDGTSTTFVTLGVYDAKQDAVARARARGAELLAQQYAQVGAIA